ncbi:hypothetical protein STEG23_000986, partial [Scotinomys teguina]
MKVDQLQKGTKAREEVNRYKKIKYLNVALKRDMEVCTVAAKILESCNTHELKPITREFQLRGLILALTVYWKMDL